MSTQRSRKTALSVFQRRLPSKTVSFSRAVYESLCTPVSLKARKLLVGGMYRELVELKIDPSTYESVEAFRRDYLAASLLSKYPSFDLGLDLQAIAARDFIEREESCKAAALRLQRNCRTGSLYSTRTLHSVLHTAREKISRLLGPIDWAEAESHFGFGPGATFSRPHSEGDPYYKIRARPCSTYGCAILAYTALRRVPAWFHHVSHLGGKTPTEVDMMPLAERLRYLFELVPGNRITFVPKSATKARTIAIEPTMNGFIQHGLGKVLEKRLRRVGIDLHDQSKNQRMAQIGSADGSLATLDLSAASDSVSLELCKQLFPGDWFDAICATRSPEGTLPDGTRIEYSKVSSMGNGMTFGIETLIFWALISSVIELFSLSDRRFTVYGDDLIIPTDAVHPVTWVLEALGFSLNRDKSFWSGPFRESCGKHYFRGDDVTPFYVRSDIDTVPRITWFANQVRRWSRLFWGLDSRLRSAYDLMVAELPPRLRNPSIPDGYGDTALFGDLDEVRPRRLPPSRGEGWLVSAWVPVIKTRVFGDTPYLIRSLMQPSAFLVADWVEALRLARIGGWAGKSVRLLDHSYGVVPRRRDPVWRRVTGVATNWPSYGPWL